MQKHWNIEMFVPVNKRYSKSNVWPADGNKPYETDASRRKVPDLKMNTYRGNNCCWSVLFGKYAETRPQRNKQAPLEHLSPVYKLVVAVNVYSKH